MVEIVITEEFMIFASDSFDIFTPKRYSPHIGIPQINTQDHRTLMIQDPNPQKKEKL